MTIASKPSTVKLRFALILLLEHLHFRPVLGADPSLRRAPRVFQALDIMCDAIDKHASDAAPPRAPPPGAAPGEGWKRASTFSRQPIGSTKRDLARDACVPCVDAYFSHVFDRDALTAFDLDAKAALRHVTSRFKKITDDGHAEPMVSASPRAACSASTPTRTRASRGRGRRRPQRRGRPRRAGTARARGARGDARRARHGKAPSGCAARQDALYWKPRRDGAERRVS